MALVNKNLFMLLFHLSFSIEWYLSNWKIILLIFPIMASLLQNRWYLSKFTSVKKKVYFSFFIECAILFLIWIIFQSLWRHFRGDAVLRFCPIFNMAFLWPNTFQKSNKTFSCNLFKVKCYIDSTIYWSDINFYVKWRPEPLWFE